MYDKTLTQEEIMLGNAAFTSKLNVIHHAYVDVCGDLVAGALLSQILYWFGADRNGRPRARIQKDGYLWIAKARADWWHEIRISPKQYDRAIRILQQCGYVELRTMKFNGNPTTHIRIKAETLNHAIDNWKRQQATEQISKERQKAMAVGFSPFGENDMYQTGTTIAPIGQYGYAPMGQAQFAESVTTLTENTAEITTKGKTDNTRSKGSAFSFEDIWKHYPKKIGRNKALSAYNNACAKGANAFAIFAETVIYNQYALNAIEREETELRYIPTGGVWYHEERWRDETQLIGRHLGYEEGIEHNKQVLRLRKLAALAGADAGKQDECLREMREIVTKLPY